VYSESQLSIVDEYGAAIDAIIEYDNGNGLQTQSGQSQYDIKGQFGLYNIKLSRSNARTTVKGFHNPNNDGSSLSIEYIRVPVLVNLSMLGIASNLILGKFNVTAVNFRNGSETVLTESSPGMYMANLPVGPWAFKISLKDQNAIIDTDILTGFTVIDNVIYIDIALESQVAIVRQFPTNSFKIKRSFSIMNQLGFELNNAAIESIYEQISYNPAIENSIFVPYLFNELGNTVTIQSEGYNLLSAVLNRDNEVFLLSNYTTSIALTLQNIDANKDKLVTLSNLDNESLPVQYSVLQGSNTGLIPVLPGNWRVSVSSAGFQTVTEFINVVTASQPLEIDMTSSTVLLQINVTDENNVALDNATVSIDGVMAVTNNAGFAEVFLAVGAHTLLVQHPEYLDFTSNSLIVTAPDTLDVQLSQRIYHMYLEFLNSAKAAIAGKQVNIDGVEYVSNANGLVIYRSVYGDVPVSYDKLGQTVSGIFKCPSYNPILIYDAFEYTLDMAFGPEEQPCKCDC
jgi:hypothetical protein